MFAQGVKGALMFIGDWNMEPAELEGCGFPRSTCAPGHTMLVQLPPADFTCTAGSARLLDYALGDREARGIESQLRLADTPWGTHAGLEFDVLAAPRAVLARNLRKITRAQAAPEEHLDAAVVPLG